MRNLMMTVSSLSCRKKVINSRARQPTLKKSPVNFIDVHVLTVRALYNKTTLETKQSCKYTYMDEPQISPSISHEVLSSTIWP